MSSKKELLEIVEKQKDHLLKYETKLRDLIRAYKGLTKEKEALEASLSALNQENSNELPSTAQQKLEESVFQKEDNAEESDSTTSSTPAPDADDPSTKNTQVTTLTSALTTLSAEKTRVEASFLADKKKLLQEKEELEQTCLQLKEKLSTLEKDNNARIEELKSRIIVERHEREREQVDHAVQIKELQSLLADGRNMKERLEAELREERMRSARLESRQPPPETERKIRDLQNELESMRKKVRRAEARASEASPLLVEMQRELLDVRSQHQSALQQEQHRALAAEERARLLAAQHEQRVASLEGRLAELSETVGTYSRLRQQDQEAIDKLKDKLSKISVEKINEVQPHAPEVYSYDDTNLDVHSLLNRIIHLKDLLTDANARSEKPVNLRELLTAHGFGATNEDHIQCREEFERLREELKKVRVQVLQPVQNRTVKISPSSDEMDNLKKQIASLHERLRSTQELLRDAESDLAHQEEKHKQELLTARESAEQSMNSTVAEWRVRLADTEKQLRIQRERSLALLEEKDSDLRDLRAPATGEAPPVSTLRADSHLLHYMQEIARRDVEIKSLRSTKAATESALRAARRDAVAQEERHSHEIQCLKSDVKRLGRLQSREGLNLEYLRNVVLQFLTTDDPPSKVPMLNAIGTILNFSPAELENCRQSNVQSGGTSWLQSSV